MRQTLRRGHGNDRTACGIEGPVCVGLRVDLGFWQWGGHQRKSRARRLPRLALKTLSLSGLVVTHGHLPIRKLGFADLDLRKIF